MPPAVPALDKVLQKQSLIGLTREWNVTRKSLVDIGQMFNGKTFLEQSWILVKEFLGQIFLVTREIFLFIITAHNRRQLYRLAHQAGGTQSPEIGKFVFQILETILSSIITFIPSHQTFESKVGILGLSLDIVTGSL